MNYSFHPPNHDVILVQEIMSDDPLTASFQTLNTSSRVRTLKQEISRALGLNDDNIVLYFGEVRLEDGLYPHTSSYHQLYADQKGRQRPNLQLQRPERA
jgi:hypothetical protein